MKISRRDTTNPLSITEDSIVTHVRWQFFIKKRNFSTERFKCKKKMLWIVGLISRDANIISFLYSEIEKFQTVGEDEMSRVYLIEDVCLRISIA